MGTDYQLYTKIASLPADLKQEVSDFVEFLKQKAKTKKKLKEGKLGSAKGLIKCPLILMNHWKTSSHISKEIIVVNDCSTDQSQAAIEQYIANVLINLSNYITTK